MPMTSHASQDGVSTWLRVALGICAVTVIGVGGFAATYEIAGAVIAGGTVVVDSKPKRVQHPTGGIVGQIAVKEGTFVKEGDVLLRLDETQTRASLMVVRKQLDELEARLARLKAERYGLDELSLSSALTARLAEEEFADTVASEHRLFLARRAARTGQQAQLRERIGQMLQELEGLRIQADAKKLEVSFVNHELEGSRSLWEKNLYPVTKYTSIQRDAARLEGERGQLVSQMAQVRGRISEVNLQIEQIDQDLQAEVMRDFRETQARMAELSERKVAAEDQLKRIELRAPQSGMIHELMVNTVGGVIQPGETVMQIVPREEDLVVEAKLSPSDVDIVYPGQIAYVRMIAFNQRTTPELEGKVQRISADLSRDQNYPGQQFYTVRVALTQKGLRDLKGQTLIPGMPAEVHLSTGDRTMLSYLVKPLQDQLVKAFKER